MADDIVAGRLRGVDPGEFCDPTPWSVYFPNFTRLDAGILAAYH